MLESGTGAEQTSDLLTRARGGDRAALEQLIARYLPAIRRWARGRLPKSARDLADTSDLVQDVLIRAITRLPEFEPRGAGSFHAYLRRAILNRIHDEVRRVRRAPLHDELDPHEDERLIDTADSPLALAIGSEQLRRFEHALMRLEPNDREAVIGRLEFGYSYEQLALALNKPTPGAARLAVRRALLRLGEEIARVR
jgi:RNA polymerase sigma-70 factor (ECF subfamily)